MATYKTLSLHEFIDLAVAGEACNWFAPSERVRVLAHNVGWDASTGEKPNGNGKAAPFNGIDTTVLGVEVGTVTVGLAGRNEAALVVSLGRRVHIAIGRFHEASEGTRLVDFASLGGVQGHFVD